MKFRDSAVWLVFIICGVAGYITGHFDKFPFIPHEYQGLVEMVGTVAAGVGLKMGTSPLELSPEGKVRKQIQDLGKSEPSQPTVLPPAA